MRRRGWPVLACLIAWAAPGPVSDATAAPVPAGFDDRLVVSNVTPTAMSFIPDGRMLITDQSGLLRVLENDVLFNALDLRPVVCNNLERGLSGVVADPNFTVNRFIYVYYTYKKHGECPTSGFTVPVNRVSRFTFGNGNTVDPQSETVLVDNIPSPSGYHSGGDLHFGKDGYLYIAVGDGGCHYDAPTTQCASLNTAARERHTVLGKVLRITADGTIPPTNPFRGPDSARCNITGRTDPGMHCQETFATGLRNPFRMAFDGNSASTRFYINDVGQSMWEEIDVGTPGADYGWNLREGACARGSSTDCGPPPDGLTNPIYAYQHTGSGAAITGGAFVPNGLWPAAYEGSYLFADFVSGRISRLTESGGAFQASSFFVAGGNVVAMMFGPPGESQSLYYAVRCCLFQIRKVTYVGSANRRPTASAQADPTAGAAPLTVAFDGTGSVDADGDALSYDWDFGDGSAHSSEPAPDHTYTSNGRYQATLRVRDPSGAEDVATVQVDVGNTPPVVNIVAPSDSTRFGVGEQVTLTANATDVQDGSVPDSRLEWVVERHHNDHTHPFLPVTTGNDVTFTAPAPEDLDAAANSWLDVHVTATDSQGLTTTETRRLLPKKVNLTFATTPAGLTLTVGGNAFAAPQTFASWKGYQLGVKAADQGSWTFRSWSDGGAAEHTITTPTTNTTYTARFDEPGSARIDGSTLVFEAGAGAINDLLVEQDASGYRITDRSGGLGAGSGCSPGSVPDQVLCPSDAIAQLDLALGDQDDKLLVNSSTKAVIDAGAGADTVTAGAGPDLIDGHTGADTIAGGPGRDTVTYAGRTTGVTADLDGVADDGGADDAAGSRRDKIGTDVEDLTGGSGGDTLTGGATSNLLDGGPGADNLSGGGGFDTVTYAKRSESVQVTIDGIAGDGSSTDQSAAGRRDLVATDVEAVTGGLGNDSLTGGTWINTLSGGPGQDTLDGRAGADTLKGGDGSDTATYADRTEAVRVDLDGIADDGNSADADSTGRRDHVSSDVENATGGQSDDRLVGDSKRNLLDGGGGKDTLDGGAGPDILRGGVGVDTVTYATRTEAVEVTLDGLPGDGGRPDEDSTGRRDDLALDVENVEGGLGKDRLVGGTGSNRLDGRAGSDLLAGGPGPDELVGGAGTDAVSYSGRIEDLVVTIGGSWSDGGASDEAGGRRDAVRSDVEDIVAGSGDDRLTGSSWINVLEGDAGDDTLDGRLGADVFKGGAGSDTVTYATRTEPVTLSINGLPDDGGSGDAHSSGHRDHITSDIENLVGGAGDDQLFGSTLANRLVGGLGTDIFRAGGGDDFLDARDDVAEPASSFDCGEGALFDSDTVWADLLPADGVAPDPANCEVVERE